MTYNSLKELFVAICDAIRNKEGSTDMINHQDIPARIRALVTSAVSVLQRNKKIKPSETETTIYPDDEYDGLSSVTVEAIPNTYIGSGVTKKDEDSYTPGTSDQYISANQYLTGTQTIKGDSDLVSSNIRSGVTIFNVEGSYVGGSEIKLEEKDSITPTKSTQTITPSSGYNGFSKVTVNPIPDKYIDTTINSNAASASTMLDGKQAYVNGSLITGNISTKSSTDVTASANVVSVPAGYYASKVEKSVGTVTQATPSISVASDGTITASATQSAGYVSSGTKSSTKTLSTQGAKTITPGTSSKTAVSSGVYTTGTVTVAGDSDLVASNIKKGVTIFDVTGSYEGEKTTPNLQDKYFTPIESSETIKCDNGYDGLNSVTVYAIPSNYIDKNSLNYIDTSSRYSVDNVEESGLYVQMVFCPSVEYVVGGDYPLTLIVNKSELGSGGDYSSGDIVQSANSQMKDFSFINSNSAAYIRYCNKSDLSASNGKVQMNSYTNLTVTSSSDCNVLKGKCIQAELTSVGSGTYTDIFYIPSNANVSVTSTGTKYVRASTAYQMFVIA